jgi:hypothetical protein
MNAREVMWLSYTAYRSYAGAETISKDIMAWNSGLTKCSEYKIKSEYWGLRPLAGLSTEFGRL